MTVHRSLLIAAMASLAAAPLAAQVRASQPGVLEIIREIVKPGRGGGHAAVERDWAGLGRQHGAPGYIALTSNSGPSEAWFLYGHDSWAAYDTASNFNGKDATYPAANRRIATEDGDLLTGTSTMQAVSLPDAGYGTFPDLSKMRVYSITTFRMKVGMEAAFTEVARQYAAIAKTGQNIAGWRSYAVVAGAPNGTFLAISTFPSFAAMDADSKAMDQAIAAAPKATVTALQKAWSDAVMFSEARYFTVSPGMSLGPKEWLSDPFWAARP